MQRLIRCLPSSVGVGAGTMSFHPDHVPDRIDGAASTPQKIKSDLFDITTGLGPSPVLAACNAIGTGGHKVCTRLR